MPIRFFLETTIELYPHNQSSLNEQMAVQILVPEFEVVIPLETASSLTVSPLRPVHPMVLMSI